MQTGSVVGRWVVPLVFVALLAIPGSARALDFSFTGMFTQDDNVQLFNFSVGAPSTVTLMTLSYAGGVNAAGVTIPRGGFDPILALFDSTGMLITQNDDGGCGTVQPDGVIGVTGTGQCWDTFLQSTLAAGSYTVSIQQYDNFAIGPTLADGFSRDGEGNFTSSFGCGAPGFCDVSSVPIFNQRDGHWGFDIYNVAQASTPSAVPEPTTLGLLGIGLLGLAGYRWRHRKHTA
jgi:hypothetical protein